MTTKSAFYNFHYTHCHINIAQSTNSEGTISYCFNEFTVQHYEVLVTSEYDDNNRAFLDKV